jgi:hypothetical protein
MSLDNTYLHDFEEYDAEPHELSDGRARLYVRRNGSTATIAKLAEPSLGILDRALADASAFVRVRGLRRLLIITESGTRRRST